MKKRQMKKWIPYHPCYCHGYVNRNNIDGYCKWWIDETNTRIHNREECILSRYCNDDCSKCKELITYCKYLERREYGQFPLGDMCKICSTHLKGRIE